jgi:hypothetical protein
MDSPTRPELRLDIIIKFGYEKNGITYYYNESDNEFINQRYLYFINKYPLSHFCSIIVSNENHTIDFTTNKIKVKGHSFLDLFYEPSEYKLVLPSNEEINSHIIHTNAPSHYYDMTRLPKNIISTQKFPNKGSIDEYENMDKEKIFDKLKEFTCSLCLTNFNNAIIQDCNHTFCNSCMLEHQKTKDTCPICKEKIKNINPFYRKYIKY